MLIYMDTCCFNLPYDDQSPICNSLEAQAKLHIQSRIRSGHIRLLNPMDFIRLEYDKQ